MDYGCCNEGWSGLCDIDEMSQPVAIVMPYSVHNAHTPLIFGNTTWDIAETTNTCHVQQTLATNTCHVLKMIFVLNVCCGHTRLSVLTIQYTRVSMLTILHTSRDPQYHRCPAVKRRRAVSACARMLFLRRERQRERFMLRTLVLARSFAA